MFAQYATIEEAWGPPVAPAPPLVNPYDPPQAKADPDQIRPDQIRRAITAAYKADGLEGVAQYVDPAVVRAIQARAPGGLFSNLSDDEVLYLMLGLAALLFVVDR